MTSLIYNTGTVSVSHGSAVVTGNLTGWAVALVTGGMLSVDGLSIPILSVESDTNLTLAYGWPGSDASEKPYAIARDTSEAVRAAWTNDRLATIIQRLSLVGVHPDGSGTLAERDALDPAPSAGYLWLYVEPGHDLAFYRKTASGWEGPFAIRGGKGDAAPLSSLTDLSDVTISDPATGKVLRYNGSEWVDAALVVADVSGAASAAAMHNAAVLAPVANSLVPAEPAAAAFDLIALAGLIRDDEDRAKSWAGDVNDLLTYASPPTKWVRNRAGVLVSGTALRCDHDPAAGEPLGVRIEPQSTNRVLQSQNFASGSWTKFASAWNYSHNDTGIAAPDGTFTASRIEKTSISQSIFLRQGSVFGVGAGTVLTISFFVYYPSGPALAIRINDDQTEATVTVNPSPRWQRLSVPWTKGSGGSSPIDFEQSGAETVGVPFWFWGVQVEQSPVATSYVPTTTEQVTRAADNISMPAALLPWNNEAGTVFVDIMPSGSMYAYNRGIFVIERTSSIPYSVNLNVSGTTIFSRVAGADGIGRAFSIAAPDVPRYKIALAWRVGRAVLTVNGVPSISPVAPVLADMLTDPVTFRIGATRGGSSPFGGTVRSARYLPYYVPDDETLAWSAAA